MRMDPEQAKTAIFRAMMENDGNRARAARSLDISIRTFYRYLDEFDMHPVLERAGWTANPGPARGGKGQGSIVRNVVFMRFREHLKEDGTIDLGKVTKDVYVQDTPSYRQKLYAVLEELKAAGRIKYDEETGRWSLT